MALIISVFITFFLILQETDYKEAELASQGSSWRFPSSLLGYTLVGAVNKTRIGLFGSDRIGSDRTPDRIGSDYGSD